MFEFKKLGDDEPIHDEGQLMIGGALLRQMEALKPGQVLRLAGQDGRIYGLARWEDLGRPVPTSTTGPT